MRKISSFALFAFLMPLAGCPSDDTGDDGATTVTPPVTSTDTGTDTAEDTVTPATDTAEDTVTPATDDTTAGGGDGGFCNLACETPADCAGAAGNEADWECNEGFCDYIAPPPACDDTTCSPAIGGVCAQVDTVEVCTYPCTDGGTECDVLMWECTGMDDAGNTICQPPPVPPCTEGDPCEGVGGQLGVCTDGVCACSSDAECTVAGYACDSSAA